MYWKGELLLRLDALSRAPPETNALLNRIIRKTIKKNNEINERCNHRKTISEELEKEDIKISKEQMKQILDECMICKRWDPNVDNASGYVRIDRPGEVLAVDLLERGPKERVIVAIDYFSRFVFAKVLI